MCIFNNVKCSTVQCKLNNLLSSWQPTSDSKYRSKLSINMQINLLCFVFTKKSRNFFHIILLYKLMITRTSIRTWILLDYMTLRHNKKSRIFLLPYANWNLQIKVLKLSGITTTNMDRISDALFHSEEFSKFHPILQSIMESKKTPKNLQHSQIQDIYKVI